MSRLRAETLDECNPEDSLIIFSCFFYILLLVGLLTHVLSMLLCFLVTVILVLQHLDGMHVHFHWYEVAKLSVIVLLLLVVTYMREKMMRDGFQKFIDVCEEERQWKEITNYLPEGVVVLNQRSHILHVNKRAYSILREMRQDMAADSEKLKQLMDLKNLKLRSGTLVNKLKQMRSNSDKVINLIAIIKADFFCRHLLLMHST
jgi:PAS domain-containing protein